MTDEQLQQLAELADAATPGPWQPSWSWGGTDETRHAVSEGPLHEGVTLSDCAPQAEADAAFIAAARDAVPALVAEVKRLRGELETVRTDFVRMNFSLADVSDERYKYRAEVERLRDAIRNADTLDELTHLVGATAEENEAAALRIERIDALYGTFGTDSTSWPESAQARLAGLMQDQDAYERRYC